MVVNKLKELRSGGAEDGFTLLELMIVVLIIGLLAAISIPIFINQQKAAIASGVKSDVKNSNLDVITFFTKHPTTTVDLSNPVIPDGFYITISPGTGNDIFVGPSTAPDAPVGIMGYQGYSINGRNPALAGTYVFDSLTGEYTDTLSW